MNFSLSTVLNTLIISSFFICIAAFLLRLCVANSRLRLYTISFLCAAAVLRLLFPFEFPFTYSVRIYHLWYGLHDFLNHHELNIFHTRIDYMHLLPILWALGSSGKLIHSFYTWRKTMRAVKELPEAEEEDALRALKICNAAFPNPAPVRLLMAPYLSSPLIVGIRTPAIVIPDLRLSEEEWCFIFRHELTHYYRGHLLLHLFFELLSDLYFWNPFLPILKKQFHRLLEFKADEEAVSSLTETHRINYSECLLKIMEYDARKSSICAGGISFGSSGFADRIKRILNTRQTSKGADVNCVILAGIMALFILSYAIILEPSYGYPEGTFSMDASDTYFRPNEDGTYDVIHDGEYLVTVRTIFDEQIPIKED